MTAFKAFFAILFDREKAERVLPTLEGKTFQKLENGTAVSKPETEFSAKIPSKTRVTQSEAVTLLAAMQREARFLDFIQEKLDGYDDSQVGAAARAVHDECAAILERFFAVQPLRSETEMSVVTVQNPDAAFVQLVGQVGDQSFGGQSTCQGRLTHHGWIATKCELPKWSGNPDAVAVLAPAEICLEVNSE